LRPGEASENPIEANVSASSLEHWETLSRREVADGRLWVRLWAEDVQRSPRGQGGT
jgi:hypothetical protein